jgi:hypothetical protein
MPVYTGPSTPQGGVIGKAETVAFTPEIWIPTIMRYRYRAMRMSQYADRMTFAGKKGDRVRKPYIGRLRTRKKTEGQPLQFERKAEGEWKMTVDKYVYSAFAITQKAELTHELSLAKAYAPEIARALMEDIEYYMLGHRAVFQAYDSTNNKITSALPIDYPDILAAFEVMLEYDFMPSELVLFIGPRQLVTMFTIPEFTQNGVYNSGDIANIKTGTIVGNVLGIDVVLDHNIRENKTDGLILGGDDYFDTVGGEAVPTPGMANSPYLPTQYGSDQRPLTLSNGYLEAGYTSALLTTKKWVALAMLKQPSLEIWWNPDYQETRFASTQIFDDKVIDPRHGVVINTDETASIADT